MYAIAGAECISTAAGEGRITGPARATAARSANVKSAHLFTAAHFTAHATFYNIAIS